MQLFSSINNSRQHDLLPINAEVRPRKVAVKQIPPEQGAIKVNWNASVWAKEQRMGIGIVARNSNGFVLACFSSFPFITTSS